MAVSIESSVVIYSETTYHTVITKLKGSPLEIYETDDVSFATTSPVEINDDIKKEKE